MIEEKFSFFKEKAQFQPFINHNFEIKNCNFNNLFIDLQITF